MKEFQDLDEQSTGSLIRDGCDLTEKTAKELERLLQSSPDDTVTRTKLLAYYQKKRLKVGSKDRDRYL